LTKAVVGHTLESVGIGGKGRILVADDQDSFRALISRMLAKEGFDPIEAKDGTSAIELYRTLKPSVVISDIIMPRMDGFALLKEIKKADPNAAVILITGHGNEEILLKALRGGATNFFKKPFTLHSLLGEIEKILRYNREALHGSVFTPFLVDESKSFAFRTADPEYSAIINQISLQLPCLLPESEILNLKMGIEEMISNAIEHGNLGISYTEKNEAISEGKLGELLTERLSRDGNGEKKVIVSSKLTLDCFRVTIRDEGKGFDWRNLPDLLPENLLTYSGRGIFMTKIYYDEVLYNERGNEVTLVKRKKDRP
jgi:DNA-binding response OmpR family regulator